ncbi:MAG TPA: DUF5667 domain-containing protein [Patescibacteria group bacterium]|nr:DUF5667 domain-containing protein [Patescibacteria group bacterium]
MRNIWVVGCFFFFFFLSQTPVFAVTPSSAYGTVNPLSYPNNKVGIHTVDGSLIEKASDLVNSSGGDWGYVTVVIRKDQRDVSRWQPFLDTLDSLHLIPIVRLATLPNGDTWEKPMSEDAKDWATFLNSLSWPVKNRYVIVYNEPNHAKEWGGEIQPSAYAIVLNETIQALKEENPDFFVLNAGFDASAPSLSHFSLDEYAYLLEMEREVPGIFLLIDGWSSHSYPNPEFSGSPTASGRGTVQGYKHEIQFLKQRFGVELPVFITETGWQHTVDGYKNGARLSPQTVATYVSQAFRTTWNDPFVVAVTPFALGYFQEPFNRFSFLKEDGSAYPQFDELKKVSKKEGSPAVNTLDKAEFLALDTPDTLLSGKPYEASVRVRNTGNTTWREEKGYRLYGFYEDGETLVDMPLPMSIVQPGKEQTFSFLLYAPFEPQTYTWKFSVGKEGKLFEEQKSITVTVLAAVHVFDQYLEYTLSEEKAIVKEPIQGLSTYSPRLLPGDMFYFLKTWKEEATKSLQPHDERLFYEISLLENRLAETVRLQEEGDKTKAEDQAKLLSSETERLSKRVGLDGNLESVEAMKAASVKQQLLLDDLLEKGGFTSPFQSAQKTAQRALKRSLDREKALRHTR